MDQEKKDSNPPKKEIGMFDYGNIHTGDPSTHPGVLKAKEEKAKQDKILAEYAAKKKAEKTKLLASLKKKKK